MLTLRCERELVGSKSASLHFVCGEFARVDSEVDHADDDVECSGSAELDLGHEFARDGQPVKYTASRPPGR